MPTPEPTKHLWYVRRAGKVRGPFPRGQITREILLGRIRMDDELSQDRETWQPVAQLPQLIPEVLRQADSAEGQQRLTLARLREDERLHDRRGAGKKSEASDKRRRDRRNVESFETVAHRDLRVRWQAEEQNNERRLLIPAAVLMTVVFALLMYFLWARPAAPPAARDCAAAPAPAVNWNGCDLRGRQLARTDLREANLASTILKRTNLQAANLLRADLRYVDFEGADLRGATLREANLVGAVLRGAALAQADLRDADLAYADLQGANLTGANLIGVRLEKTIWTDGRVCAADSVGACR